MYVYIYIYMHVYIYKNMVGYLFMCSPIDICRDSTSSIAYHLGYTAHLHH